MTKQFNDIKAWYRDGQVFAYPTEAVYGLGCDPQNENAVHKILNLKSRAVEKGMILIASDFIHIQEYVLFDELPLTTQQTILASWPGPVTWLLPKSSYTPKWISGDSDMVAVRLSAHPLVQAICQYLQKPMVSTSANPAGQPPATSIEEVKAYFGNKLNLIEGELGSQRSPSKIFHSLTMETIRS
jgi:L-threonylcarbamoyladenylate synthase